MYMRECSSFDNAIATELLNADLALNFVLVRRMTYCCNLWMIQVTEKHSITDQLINSCSVHCAAACPYIILT